MGAVEQPQHAETIAVNAVYGVSAVLDCGRLENPGLGLAPRPGVKPLKHSCAPLRSVALTARDHEPKVGSDAALRLGHKTFLTRRESRIAGNAPPEKIGVRESRPEHHISPAALPEQDSSIWIGAIPPLDRGNQLLAKKCFEGRC